MKSTNKTG